MSASLRFLAIAVLGWAGLRAASIEMLPDAEAFTLGTEPASALAASSDLPAIVPTQFPPLEPPRPSATQLAPYHYPSFAAAPGFPPGSVVPIYYVPVGAAPPRFYPASLPARRSSKLTPVVPMPAPQFYSPIPQLDEWPLSRIASRSLPARRSTVTTTANQSVPPELAEARLDRFQLTAWALLRGRPGPSSLATSGTLGGSQAGARFAYNVSHQVALSLRMSSPVGGPRGGEVAAGVRLTPLRSIPLSWTIERRQAIGSPWVGRSGFAMFVEGGVWDRPAPWRFVLDGYAQAGVVGARDRDWFADGGFTLTRPVIGRVSAGFGAWGGAQPGIYRIDAGPRLSLRVRDNMRVHLDWRQRLAGNAEPGSGPAVTLAGDF